MKIGVIMAVVGLALMKLITEATFNLFKTFELYWIVHLTNYRCLVNRVYGGQLNLECISLSWYPL